MDLKSLRHLSQLLMIYLARLWMESWSKQVLFYVFLRLPGFSQIGDLQKIIFLHYFQIIFIAGATSQQSYVKTHVHMWPFSKLRNILSFIPALSKHPYQSLCSLRGSPFCICFWFHPKTKKKTLLSDLHLKYSISCSSVLDTYKRSKMLQWRYTVR